MIEKVKHLGFPFLFVALYGSGFVGAKYGLPYSTPLSFLTLRFFLAGLILLFIMKYMKVNLPSIKDIFHISIAGILTVAVFSIGIFISIDMGLSPALSAMIIALQPILVAVLAKSFLSEDTGIIQAFGLLVGLVGVMLVLVNNMDITTAGLYSIALSVFGLLGLSLGNLYQKKFCENMNIFSGGAIQSIASGFVCLILMLMFDSYEVVWTSEFIYALLFMTIGVSIGALSLLYIMIRRAEVSKVASIFYLIPVSAAISGYFIYGETFELITILGIAIVALGVYLSNY